jgi:broad specificity phosphatase PhoE
MLNREVKMLTKMFAALLLVLTGAAACVSPPASPPQVFYVMRHLQKGTGDDPPLSAEGSANAQRLVAVLKENPPRAIFVSTTRRARETAAPLATALGVTMTPYDAKDSAALVQSAAAEKGSVLIVGHSNTVPDIIRRFGAAAPPPLSDEDYGDIWRIDRQTRAVTKMRVGN